MSLQNSQLSCLKLTANEAPGLPSYPGVGELGKPGVLRRSRSDIGDTFPGASFYRKERSDLR